MSELLDISRKKGALNPNAERNSSGQAVRYSVPVHIGSIVKPESQPAKQNSLKAALICFRYRLIDLVQVYFLLLLSMIAAPSHHARNVKSEELGSGARFKLMADSSQDAAKLLLQVRRIAIDELIHGDSLAAPVTPVQRPRIFVPTRHVSLAITTSPSSNQGNRRKIDSSPPNIRFRTVSICSHDIEESTTAGHVSPLQDHPSRSRESPERLERTSFPTCIKNIDEEESIDATHLPDSHKDYHGSPYSNKYVGDKLPEGVKTRDVLRKKFSWKSFPELETYLVDHRLKYLECSNALNYTKAQKLYNNQLTQGLLDLAGKEGYIFEGFTFAAVRDRIRCFYKSFVQATKKKKRLKVQKRGRSVTM
jgi:hypothetical protein